MSEQELDYQLEIGGLLYQLALYRKEWFRDAKATRMMLEKKREEMVRAWKMSQLAALAVEEVCSN